MRALPPRGRVGRGGGVAARTVPVEWDAYAVGPRETSLELIVQHGVCGPIQTRVAEGHDSVVIDIDEQQGSGACPAVATIGPLDVRLAHPLAGRTIQGPSRQRLPILFLAVATRFGAAPDRLRPTGRRTRAWPRLAA